MYLSEKAFLCENVKLYNSKDKQPNKQIAQTLEQTLYKGWHITEHVINEHEKCLLSWVIKEMEIKTTTRNHHTPTRSAKNLVDC